MLKAPINFIEIYWDDLNQDAQIRFEEWFNELGTTADELNTDKPLATGKLTKNNFKPSNPALNPYNNIPQRCDNTNHIGKTEDVQKIELQEEFEGGFAYWCKDCRNQDYDMILEEIEPAPSKEELKNN